MITAVDFWKLRPVERVTFRQEVRSGTTVSIPVFANIGCAYVGDGNVFSAVDAGGIAWYLATDMDTMQLVRVKGG